MNTCIKCGSYAFNLYKEDIDQGGLCDVHYWQGRAHRAEAKQEKGEPVACIHRNEYNEYRLEPHDNFDIKSIPFNVDVPLFKESQPAQKPWVGLMRGVRVEGDTVVISVHYGNDAARQLCSDLIKEMNT